MSAIKFYPSFQDADNEYARPDRRRTTADFWADGQMISGADDETDAINTCREVLGFWPEVVRPWTNADQARLDQGTEG